MPNEKQQLVVTLHPSFYKTNRKEFSYKKNKLSTAYTPNDKGKYYFMDGFNGGYTQAFLLMCEEISKNIKKDLENNIIEVCHNESYLNKYMVDKNPLILISEYAYQKDWGAMKLKEIKKYEDNE